MATETDDSTSPVAAVAAAPPPPAPPTAVGGCLLPWPAIVAVLEQFRTELDAIAAALPASPVLVPTPALLPLLTGRPWPAETQLSHRLVQLYVAALFYLNAPDPRPPVFLRINEDLQRDQAHAYRDHAFDDHAFVLAYLHAYERALLKHLHVRTHAPSTAAVADAMGTPPPPEGQEEPAATFEAVAAYHVLAMTPTAEAAAAPFLTQRVLVDDTAALQEAVAAMDATRDAVGINPLV